MNMFSKNEKIFSMYNISFYSEDRLIKYEKIDLKKIGNINYSQNIKNIYSRLKRDFNDKIVIKTTCESKEITTSMIYQHWIVNKIKKDYEKFIIESKLDYENFLINYEMLNYLYLKNQNQKIDDKYFFSNEFIMIVENISLSLFENLDKIIKIKKENIELYIKDTLVEDFCLIEDFEKDIIELINLLNAIKLINSKYYKKDNLENIKIEKKEISNSINKDIITKKIIENMKIEQDKIQPNKLIVKKIFEIFEKIKNDKMITIIFKEGQNLNIHFLKKNVLNEKNITKKELIEKLEKEKEYNIIIKEKCIFDDKYFVYGFKIYNNTIENVNKDKINDVFVMIDLFGNIIKLNKSKQIIYRNFILK